MLGNIPLCSAPHALLSDKEKSYSKGGGCPRHNSSSAKRPVRGFADTGGFGVESRSKRDERSGTTYPKKTLRRNTINNGLENPTNPSARGKRSGGARALRVEKT